MADWHHGPAAVPREVLELPLHSFEPQRVAALIEECFNVRCQKDELEAQYDALRDELAEIQQAEGLDAIRHRRIVFRCRRVEGKQSLVREKLFDAMRSYGLADAVIAQVLHFATKTGNEYFVKEIGVIE